MLTNGKMPWVAVHRGSSELQGQHKHALVRTLLLYYTRENIYTHGIIIRNGCNHHCNTPTQPPTKAIIVHPRFNHTLPNQQTTHHHAEKTGWDKLPVEVLLHVAAHLSTAKELCLFARISYTTRYVLLLMCLDVSLLTCLEVLLTCLGVSCPTMSSGIHTPPCESHTRHPVNHSIAARDEWLWRRLCEDAFAVPRDCNPPSWRQLYAFNHQLLRMCLGQHARGGTGTAYHVGHRGYLRVRVRA